MKDLGKPWYYIGMQIKQCKDGILLHQENYTYKVLKQFSDHDRKPSSTIIIVCSLYIKNNPFLTKEDDK